MVPQLYSVQFMVPQMYRFSICFLKQVRAGGLNISHSNGSVTI
jgi:hypothetical protein